MRVCLLHIVDAPEQFGGAEKIFLTLCSEFSKGGEVQVVAAVNKGVLWEKVASCRLKTYILPDKCVSRIPSFYLNLYRILKEFKPDIVHSHHRYTTFLSHRLPFRNYKLIHTFHIEQFTRRWNRFYGDYTTAVSRGCKDHFVKYFNMREDSITVIYNGVDFPHSSPPEPAFKKQDERVIASVIARFTEQKGHIVLLKAITLLPNSVRDRLRVFFIGDGEKRKELEDKTKKFGLEKNIVFTGYQEDVYAYINISDFTILPSLWEGFPLAIVESFMCSKPVICSAIAGNPEVVIDKETGLLVPSNNPERLAQAIVYFMDNPALVKKFGEAGEKLALEKFTVGKMIENYKAFYKKVLEENNAR